MSGGKTSLFGAPATAIVVGTEEEGSGGEPVSLLYAENDEDERDTDRPTASDHEPPEYLGEPPQGFATLVYEALVSPNGDLPMLRAEIKQLVSEWRERTKVDDANWQLLRQEVIAVRDGLHRVEVKLGKIETRVTVLEYKFKDLEQRLAAIEAQRPA